METDFSVQYLHMQVYLGFVNAIIMSKDKRETFFMIEKAEFKCFLLDLNEVNLSSYLWRDG